MTMHVGTHPEGSRGQTGSYRLVLSILLCLLLPVALTAGDGTKRLSERVLASDGDLERVPLWEWFNSLTGENAAFVLGADDELADIRVHRTWRRGQTVGQVVYNLEQHLGRFRVHFERDSVSLVSLPVRERMLLPENRKQHRTWVRMDEPSDWKICPSLLLEFGVMQSGCFGLEGSRVLLPTLEACFRVDSFFGGRLLSYAGNFAVWSFFPGLRWTPLRDWLFSPYIQAGPSYNIVPADQGVPDQSGFGATVALGLRIGANPDNCFLADVGFARVADTTMVQFRVGYQYGL